MRLLRHQPLTANEYRQCLRIATGATLGFLSVNSLVGKMGYFIRSRRSYYWDWYRK